MKRTAEEMSALKLPCFSTFSLSLHKTWCHLTKYLCFNSAFLLRGLLPFEYLELYFNNGSTDDLLFTLSSSTEEDQMGENLFMFLMHH